jgi:hypothetical protein
MRAGARRGRFTARAVATAFTLFAVPRASAAEDEAIRQEACYPTSAPSMTLNWKPVPADEWLAPEQTSGQAPRAAPVRSSSGS